MPTDYETHIATPGRDDLIKQVRARINDLGVEHLYLQVVSVGGRIVGKGIPAEHWESVTTAGVRMACGAMADVLGDQSGGGAGDVVAVPEPETFVQLPWDKRVGRLFCTVFRSRDEREDAGAALASDCRGNLRRIHDRFEKEHGLRLRLGTGPEVMWLRKDAEGRPSGICSSPQAGGVDQLESLRPVVLRVIEYARRMGLDVTQCGHGDAPGQLRLELDHDDALRAADRLATYRQICAQVARELNLVACFMGKPFTDAPANGCDHIFALWKGGKDEIRSLGNDLKKLPGLDQSYMYRRGGDNAFMPDTDDVRLPGKMALSAIGGILQHLAGLLAIGCPTVNSYRGLADAMSRSSLRPGWSLQGRSTAVRVSAPGRIDYRGVDTMVNPYLMAAGLLRAMDDGIRSKLDAGAPEDRDATPAPENGRARGLRTTLGDSLAALASDDVVRSAMPGELYDLYDRGKREEWRRFLHTATDWDLRTYLGSLP